VVTRVRPARAGAASPRRPARRACSGPASSSRCGRAPHAAPRRPAPRPAAAFGNAFVRCRAPARSPEQPFIHPYIMSRMRTQNCRGCRDVAQKDTQQWLSTTQVHFARCLHTKSTHCEVVTRFRAGKVLHLGRLPVGLAHPAGPERAHDAHVLPDQHGLIDVKALKPQALAPPVPGTPRLCCASPGCRCHVQGLAAAAHMCILSMEASGGRRMC
jgi:hypothetical protein